MKFIVVCNNANEAEFMAAHFLPVPAQVAKGADRVYRLYRSNGGHDQAFTDNGESLIEMHAFDTLAEAEAWVNEDVRQRNALLSANGRKQ